MQVTQYRTQLYLDKERYVWLKQKAKEEDKAMAQVVREILDKVRVTQKTTTEKRKVTAYKKIRRLVGSIKGGPKDLSTHHDKYLGEALYQEILRNRGK